MKVFPIRNFLRYIQEFERLFLTSNWMDIFCNTDWKCILFLINNSTFLSFQLRKQKSHQELKKNLNWEYQKVPKWASPPSLKMTSNGYHQAGRKFGQRAIRTLHQTMEISNYNLLPKWITLLFPHTIRLLSGNQDIIWQCK